MNFIEKAMIIQKFLRTNSFNNCMLFTKHIELAKQNLMNKKYRQSNMSEWEIKIQSTVNKMELESGVQSPCCWWLKTHHITWQSQNY